MDGGDEVRRGVVREEEGVVGGELEDATGGQAGEHQAGHQLGVTDDSITADQVNIKVQPGHVLCPHGIF